MISKSNSNFINRNEIILTDWDGVIQDIGFYWGKRLLQKENFKFFQDYLDYTKLIKKDKNLFDCMNERDTYYYFNWLEKENVKYDSISREEVFNLFQSIYTDDDNFYDNCPYLNFAYGVKSLMGQSFCKKIIFLSHSKRGYGDERKEKQFNKYFKSNKTELICIPSSITKDEWIMKNCPDYTMFVDDRLDIVEKVILNTDSKNKTIIIPEYGYNKNITEDIMNLISVNEITFSYYKSEIINKNSLE